MLKLSSGKNAENYVPGTSSCKNAENYVPSTSSCKNAEDYVPLRDLTMDDLLDPGPYKEYVNVRGQHPLPLERRKLISINEVDDYIDFTKVNSAKLINALRIFLFSYRDVLLLGRGGGQLINSIVICCQP